MALQSTITFDDSTAAIAAALPNIEIGLKAAVESLGRFYVTNATLDILVKAEDLGETVLAEGGPGGTVMVRQYTQLRDMLLKNGPVPPADPATWLKQAAGTVYNVHQATAAYEITTGVDANGTEPDIIITINTQAIAGGWFYFDPAPRDRNPIYEPLVPDDLYDFFDVARHELAHGLGLTGWRDPLTGAIDRTMSVFDRWTLYDGAQPNPLPYFIGPAATMVYGQPIPLVDGNIYHYRADIGSLGGLFSAAAQTGTRLDLTALDIAILRDLGLNDLALTTTGTPGNDSLVGTALPDNMNGGDGNDTLWGGGGADVLVGGAGDDVLSGDPIGAANPDILMGGTGNDYMDGGGGDDHLDGGAGRDTILGSLGADVILGGAGDDVLFGDYYTDRYRSGANAALARDGTHADIIDGGAGNDWIAGGAGPDVLTGGTGSDTFSIADIAESRPDARDRITDFRGNLQERFENGTHTVLFSSVGGATAQLIPGQQVVDFRGAAAHTQRDIIDLSEIDAQVLTPGKQGFVFIGQAPFTAAGQVRWVEEGNNIVIEGNVDNNPDADFAIELTGIAGSYALTALDFNLGSDSARAAMAGDIAQAWARGGAAAPEGVVINLGAQTVANAAGAVQSIPYARNAVGTYHGDRVYGDGADNVLWGEDGADTMFGNTGNDTMYGGYGRDQLSGGAGDDVLYGNADGDRLMGNRGNDTLFGGSGDDALYGNLDHDVLYGNRGSDTLFGGAGDDTLFGGLNADVLYGGIGNDELHGNRGDDTLWGGAGADRFVIGGGAGRDVIADFNPFEGDRIVLSPGVGWSVVADGRGNAVLALPGGHSVTLQGIAPVQVSDGWILAG
ncbi:calcium-binding protein [Azospirillum halopraeferens]|uniref:calcium-binding protein n=1 Tax=Azospirillum halopraeferens TaxID=34010 RepID=UPI0004024BED|nr:calcium-binding protein [Azospirillum halopraeferens]